MKCDELQQRLDDYLDGDLDTILIPILEKHLESCVECAAELDYANAVKAGINQLSSLERIPNEEFIAGAFEKVRACYPETDRNDTKMAIGLKTGFVSAIAAGFALWAVVTSFILAPLDSDNNPQQYVSKGTNSSSLNLTIDKVKVLRLAIDTPDDFDKVTLSVILPNHVELTGHKNKREISWDTKLAKGNNILRIPLKAIKTGQGNFIARLTHNGKVKTFELFLQSTPVNMKEAKPKKPDLSHIDTIKLHV